MTNKEIILKKIKSTHEDILSVVFVYQKDYKLHRCLVEDLVEEFDYAMAFSRDFIFVPHLQGENMWYDILPRNPEVVIKQKIIAYLGV